MQTALAVPAGFSPLPAAVLPKAGNERTQTAAALGPARCVTGNEQIFGEGDPARFLYRVSTGVVRTYKLLSDGRRQIEAFHVHGDVFGFETDDVHRSTAEAVSNATVVAFRRSNLETSATDGNPNAKVLVGGLMRSLERTRQHLLLLGRKTAIERIATFLLDLAARTSGHAIVDLPMSRYDIADYLGLTIETVSRTLTHLQRDGVVEISTPRHVVLRNMPALRRLAG